KKNKIDFIYGYGKLKNANTIVVTDNDKKTSEISAKNIIVATGGRANQLPTLPIDGEKVIEYRKAMSLSKLPKKMVVIGSGAIGSEFAYFYQTMGTEVTLIEYFPNIVPMEDEEVSKQLERSFKKMGMNVLTGAEFQKVDTSGKQVTVEVKTKKGVETFECDVVLSAVGVKANIENIGLEEVGVATDKG